MTARDHILNIAAMVREVDTLTVAAEAQIRALSTEAQAYLEAVHTEKQAGESDPALSFSCTKKAEMDAIAVRLRTASQWLIGIGNNLRRFAP